MGNGFLTGLMGSVGKGLQKSNERHYAEQAQEKQRQLDANWTAMQNAATTLARLKQKQDGGQQLTPEEEQEAKTAAGVWQSASGDYAKATKSNKPASEAFGKISGFVTKMLTSKKNQLSGPQGAAQPGQPPQQGGSPAAMGNGGLLGTGSVPKAGDSSNPQDPQGPQSPPEAQKPSPNGKLTPPPAAQGAAPTPSASGPLTAPPKAPQASMPQLDPKQQAMAYGSPQFGKDQEADRAQKQKLGFEQAEFDAWNKRGTDLGLKGRDLAEYAGSKGQKLPPQSKPVVERGITREGYDGAWNHTVDPDGSETWSKQAPKETKSGVPRVIGHISSTDAKGQAGKGKTFEDEAGNEIDVSELPEQMALQAVSLGGKLFYVPVTQNQTHFSVGGKMYAVPTLEQVNMSKGAGVELGNSRTPTQSTHQQIAVDAHGDVTTNTLHSSSTPQTPGIAGRPNGSPSPGAPPPASGKPAAPKQGAPSGEEAKPSGDLRGIPLGMYNQSLQRVTPVREAATQLFGDPQQPDLKGLISFADLADNKESRERLGKALKLTFDQLSQATGGAHISAGAGPVSVSTGGVGTVLENYFGVPQTVASQQSKIMQDAIGSLTPEEWEAYDATMSAFGTIVGLRSLTKASAAQASVATIEREMPVIGVNTVNSSQFYDQMQRLAEQVYSGAKGIPKGMIDEGMRKRIEELPSEMQKRKKGAGASPNGKLDKPGAKVKMKSPDGKSTQEVNPGDVEYYKKLGATVVK